MEISIKVELNEKKDLENFIEECQKHGFLITREGGGNMPNYSGYFAQLKGERWKKLHTSDSGLNIADVSVPKGTVCYYKPCLDQYNGKCLHSGKYPTCKNKQTAR